MTFVTHVQRALCEAMNDLPEQFYDSFEFTSTGKNLTHPLTIGIIANALSRHPSVKYVGIDVRLKGFRPDVVGYSTNMEPLIYIDYESPNSSDFRVCPKDVKQYRAWKERSQSKAQYIIVTTLPDYECTDWKLLYTKEGYYNDNFQGSCNKIKIRQNPFKFWYCVYQEELRDVDLTGISFLNISGIRVKQVPLKSKHLR